MVREGEQRNDRTKLGLTQLPASSSITPLGYSPIFPVGVMFSGDQLARGATRFRVTCESRRKFNGVAERCSRPCIQLDYLGGTAEQRKR
jgi:hypothetical protein